MKIKGTELEKYVNGISCQIKFDIFFKLKKNSQ